MSCRSFISNFCSVFLTEVVRSQYIQASDVLTPSLILKLRSHLGSHLQGKNYGGTRESQTGNRGLDDRDWAGKALR